MKQGGYHLPPEEYSQTINKQILDDLKPFLREDLKDERLNPRASEAMGFYTYYEKITSFDDASFTEPPLAESIVSKINERIEIFERNKIDGVDWRGTMLHQSLFRMLRDEDIDRWQQST